MYHIVCIHSSVEGYFGCFQFLAIMNIGAMSIGEICHSVIVYNFLGHMLTSAIAEFGSNYFQFPERLSN